MAVPMPVGDNISALADWVELRVSSEKAGMPLTRLDRLLKAEGSELADEELGEGGDTELEVRLASEDAASAEVDMRVELIRQEVFDRSAIGTKVYPFSVDRERVRSRDVCGRDVYLLLLVLGSGDLPYRAERRTNEVEEAYDYVALEALRRFLGRGADGLRFARTARPDEHETEDDPLRRPTSFAEAISWLRDWLDLGPGVRSPQGERDTENHWEDDDEPPPPLGRAPLTSYNDAGVDVVVWWQFADRRAGFPVMLAQCTVQLRWEEKVEDIALVMWQKWIDFDTVPPQRALVIPFADQRDHPLWPDRTSRAGVILDRVRLIELLDELACERLTALIDQRTRDWTQTELAAA